MRLSDRRLWRIRYGSVVRGDHGSKRTAEILCRIARSTAGGDGIAKDLPATLLGPVRGLVLPALLTDVRIDEVTKGPFCFLQRRRGEPLPLQLQRFRDVRGFGQMCVDRDSGAPDRS